ncbi:hypothetical protein SO802_015780 [Lithocarpus litseifolius]|uniref:Uncharacterized protein n=1 Tax=Lithocarpus litseifolius TaxID=425828 RepID=A0AAW2CVZ3_9ROSI
MLHSEFVVASEDSALKHQLELYVERIQNYCPVVQRNALQSLGVCLHAGVPVLSEEQHGKLCFFLNEEFRSYGATQY